MKVACPTCGADVEFRYDDSFVRVCDSCRAAVLRTDRGVESLGKLADLTPVESPLTLFAEGKHEAGTFLLVGMAQIQHARGGVWQEWYAKFDGDTWGWLAEAQGRLFLTFAATVEPELIPSFDAAAPGTEVMLPVDGKRVAFTVSERGTARYVSATGEIPYRLEPTHDFRFADLSSADGAFATIDYGEQGEVPAAYVGRQVSLAQLGISGGETLPGRGTTGTAGRLACPSCDGSLELRAPDQTLRVACPYCNHLIDVSGGALSVLGKLSSKPTPAIPLGSKGTFAEGELTVIGYLKRSAYVDGSWYAFDEYLLHSSALGFRWLVASDHHWSYVQPVASGAVNANIEYDGVTFAHFSSAHLRVDAVYGEFYWKVAIGDLVLGDDYIAPPAMLSRESSKDEETWSLSTYLTIAEVQRAFPGTTVTLPAPLGVGANQPYPLHGWGWVAAALVVLLCVLGIAKASASHATEAVQQRFMVKGPVLPATLAAPIYDPNDPLAPYRAQLGYGSTPPPTPSPNAADITPTVEFSPAFHLVGGRNVELAFQATELSNDYVYAAVDLVDEATGTVISIDQNLEYYSGYEGGESWDEGDRSAHQVIGPVPTGDYVLRVEAQHGSYGNVGLEITVRQGVFRGRYLLIAFLLLGLPFVIIGFHANAFKKKRMENANTYALPPGTQAPDEDDDE